MFNFGRGEKLLLFSALAGFDVCPGFAMIKNKITGIKTAARTPAGRIGRLNPELEKNVERVARVSKISTSLPS
jgi:hypothetical protein